MKTSKVESYTLVWPDEAATARFAVSLASMIKAPFVMTLSGEIGTGKTTFIRALLRALHVEGPIKSPTFSLVETYDLPTTDTVFHHLDLYRLEAGQSVDMIGFHDYFTPDAICCIEWPERVPGGVKPVDLGCSLTCLPTGRQACMQAQSAHGQALLMRMMTVES